MQSDYYEVMPRRRIITQRIIWRTNLKVTFSKFNLKLNDATIEHVPVKVYVPADGFSQLHLRNDVRQYVRSCATKMDAINKTYGRPGLSCQLLDHIKRIVIDTIGPLPNGMGSKHIIVILDRFIRYAQLFLKKEVTAMAVADDLWRHTCRFTAPLEIVTNFGSQFLNQRLTYHN